MRKRILYLKVADYFIKLVLIDEELIRFITKEYHLCKNNVTPLEGVITIDQLNSNLLYRLQSRSGKIQEHLTIPRNSIIGFKEFVLQALIELCLFKKNLFFLHGSSFLTSFNNTVQIFLGPSGAGKTTILNILREGDVYSNDTALLQIKKNKYVLHPSPFDKKTGVKITLISKERKINIFILRQHTSNTIQKMELQQKLEEVRKNMNYFMFLEQINGLLIHDVTSYNRRAYKYLFLLVKQASIRKLFFTKKISKNYFKSML